jgi:hypothetical protein
MSEQSEPPSRPIGRRPLTFSLRTLLIVMVVASLALAFIAHPLYQWRQQELLIKEIHKRSPSRTIEYGNGSKKSAWVEVLTISQASDVWLLREHKLPMFSGLTYLHLCESKTVNRDLANLAGCNRLRDLHLSGQQFTDEAIEHLRSLPRLQAISMDRCSLTRHGFKEISAMGNIKYINLFEMPVTDAEVAALSTIPNLRALSFYKAHTTDATVRLLAKQDKLIRLKFRHCPIEGDFGLSPGDWPLMRQFDASSTPFNDRGLAQLVHCQNIEWLHLENTEITDEAIPLILQLPNLQFLEISGKKISLKGLRHLAGHPRLWSLKVGSELTDEDAVSLAKAMRRSVKKGERYFQ